MILKHYLPNFEKKYLIENSFDSVNNNVWDSSRKWWWGYWGVARGANGP